MKLIAHRGNQYGKNPEMENKPEYIDQAIFSQYDVEIDLRMVDGELFLGHDAPQYKISQDWLEHRNQFLWIHCKNREALHYLTAQKNPIAFNYFWHDTDEYTLTSKGYVWAYPGRLPAGPHCICVMPELHYPIEAIAEMKTLGICSDFVADIKKHK